MFFLLLTPSQIEGFHVLGFITNLDGFVQKSQHKVLTIGVVGRTGQSVALKQSQSVGRWWTESHGHATEMKLKTAHVVVVGGGSGSSVSAATAAGVAVVR